MEIKDLSRIDPELHGQILDFVYSIRAFTSADACVLKITNNVLNVIFKSGEPKGEPCLVIRNKERTHINCILYLYGTVFKESTLIFHLKTQLELLRQLIKNRLQLYFKQKWEELGIFFQLENYFSSLREEEEIFKEIMEILKRYINRFVDIDFMGLVYDAGDKNFFLAETDTEVEALNFLSKSILRSLQKEDIKWFEKNYVDHWLIAKRFSNYTLCLAFKGEPHPIYATAISFLASEVLMLLSSIRWARFHQDVSHEFMKGFISALEAKDLYTRGHSEGVAYYAEIIGKSLGLDTKELAELKLAAILHDIGKVGIPDYILFKPGKLSEKEYGIIKLHSVIGSELLKKIKRFSRFSTIVRFHHERWDGKGYPDGLKGEEIPPFSRIIAVADAYDAMLGDRVYRRAKTKEEALKELENCAGTQFDPYIIKKCIPALKNSATYQPKYHSFVPQTIEEVRKTYFFTDTLTGVRNTFALFKDVESFETPFYLIFFDLKKFKFFNIKEGIVKGNKILFLFANELTEAFKTPTVYRVGGDDFVVVLKEKPSIKELTDLKKNITKKLGLGVRYEVRKVESVKDLEKVLKELKLLSYCDFLVEEHFHILSPIFDKLVLLNKRKRVVSMKGIDRKELRRLLQDKSKFKPLHYEGEIIGYVYAE